MQAKKADLPRHERRSLTGHRSGEVTVRSTPLVRILSRYCVDMDPGKVVRGVTYKTGMLLSELSLNRYRDSRVLVPAGRNNTESTYYLSYPGEITSPSEFVRLISR